MIKNSFLLSFIALAFTLQTSLITADTPKKAEEKKPAYTLSDEGYLKRPELEALILKLEKEPGLSRERLTKLFSGVSQQQGILEAISRPAERTLNWARYRDIFIRQSRVDGGVEFWEKHKDTLLRASKEFHVPPEIIVAIIGVETRYGKHAGSYRVIDALTTLGFDYPPRSAFFYKELEQFLLLENYAGIDIEKTKGSYAGAMGFGQFIPSSYRHYAVDFDNDGKIDLLNNPVDAIGSVANYFKQHGWQANEPVASRAFIETSAKASDKKEALQAMINIKGLKPQHKIKDFEKLGMNSLDNFSGNAKASAYNLEGKEGEELWLCLDNFYVITRYNHSKLYAMAVFQLSQLIKLEKQIGQAKP